MPIKSREVSAGNIHTEPEHSAPTASTENIINTESVSAPPTSAGNIHTELERSAPTACARKCYSYRPRTWCSHSCCNSNLPLTEQTRRAKKPRCYAHWIWFLMLSRTAHILAVPTKLPLNTIWLVNTDHQLVLSLWSQEKLYLFKRHKWHSSNKLQVAASIPSGNNFAKIEKWAKFLGLSFLSDSTFYRMQQLYLIPCINEWWSWQREQLVQEFIAKEIVVCGDGHCDSLGHTAKNLCYFLMELVSGYILEVEVQDKRHVSLASSKVEKQALQNALQRLQRSLSVVEVVTDASPSIKKLIGKLIKNNHVSGILSCLGNIVNIIINTLMWNYMHLQHSLACFTKSSLSIYITTDPSHLQLFFLAFLQVDQFVAWVSYHFDNFSTVFHSLDIWYKSQSIRKCLAKVKFKSNSVYCINLYPFQEMPPLIHHLQAKIRNVVNALGIMLEGMFIYTICLFLENCIFVKLYLLFIFYK